MPMQHLCVELMRLVVDVRVGPEGGALSDLLSTGGSRDVSRTFVAAGVSGKVLRECVRV